MIMDDMYDWHPLFNLIETYRHDSNVAPVIEMMDEANETSMEEVLGIKEEDFDNEFDYTDAICDFQEEENARRYRVITKRVRRLVNVMPSEPGLHALLGYCYEQVPECYGKRTIEYERAIELSPHESTFKRALCKSLWDEAKTFVRYRTEQSPSKEGRIIAWVWWEGPELEKKVEPWISWENTVIDCSEEELRRFKNLSERCLQLCDEVLKSNPDDSETYRLKARILAELVINRLEEALEALSKALELSNREDEYYIHQEMGELFFELGRYEQALKHFQVVPRNSVMEECDELEIIDEHRREILIEECKRRLQLKKLLLLNSMLYGLKESDAS